MIVSYAHRREIDSVNTEEVVILVVHLLNWSVNIEDLHSLNTSVVHVWTENKACKAVVNEYCEDVEVSSNSVDLLVELLHVLLELINVSLESLVSLLKITESLIDLLNLCVINSLVNLCTESLLYLLLLSLESFLLELNVLVSSSKTSLRIVQSCLESVET